MKYYQVGVSSEPKIIGVKNGIHQVQIDKEEMIRNFSFKEFLDFFRSQNSTFFENQEIIKEFKIPAIKAEMLVRAKRTDIMGYTPNVSFLNRLYSAKYIDILKKFNVGNYTTFKVNIDGVEEIYLCYSSKRYFLTKLIMRNRLSLRDINIE